ncbi:hypothetical protein J5226_15705 [Lysobacter sp. K5869]|uniref:hypothetical protein n=1 Tax=Lysobacter sp. K5869 TaxID=2820808 RepID=UPI001C064380|nr:hypothetical protein [Lysobacter sp. K5869]QWP75077.1 hypothetical protein J5226_15705 [Lysobacter sp. K5869]
MSHLLESHRLLEGIDSTSLRFKPKTDEPIETMLALSRHLRALNRIEVIELRKRLNDKLSFKLMYLSVLAAEKSLNSSPLGWLHAAVAAHALEGMRMDYRENYLRLADIAHAARKAGVSEARLLEPFNEQLDDNERGLLWRGLAHGNGRKIEIQDGIHRFAEAHR